MTVNVQFVKMASSETRTAYVSKKLEKLTEKYDWSLMPVYILNWKTIGQGTIRFVKLN